MTASNGIAIAADFTADPIADALEFWRGQLGWNDEIRFAPYNQVIQSVLDPATAPNVILLRASKLSPEFTGELAKALAGRGPVLIVFCPAVHALDEEAAAATLAGDSVYVVRSAEILQRYPVNDIYDAHAEDLGDVPYTPLFFAALGTTVARMLHALRVRPAKVIALDCDNTLWKGTCGEDGPEGVVIDAARRNLQQFMLARRDAGMLLTLTSKNNYEDVAETFRVHPEMPLQWEDFLSHRIDWAPKGPHLAAMAAELNLGLDSFVFVDDNPKETGEVEAGYPEVTCLTLPHHDDEIPHFLNHVWIFDQLRVTEEDRKRNESYRQQAERGKVEKTAGSLGDFIAQLHVDVHIQPVTPGQVARVAQLTQRTNQMNTTLIRRTEAEVSALVGSDPVQCLTVDVTDRFGSYGLVGAMFLRWTADTLLVDSILLSCRALGRGVEHQMLAYAGQLAVAAGKSAVEVGVVEGPRNQPARQFIGAVGTRLSAEACAALQYVPDAKVELIAETPKVSTEATASKVNYGHIAAELSRPGQILSAIAEERRARNAHLAAGEAVGSPLERTVAGIWAEVLHIPTPGLDEDFFDLGGHSLLAVQLLSRIRQETGVDLSLDIIYSGRLTVAGMAAAVELAQADPEEVDRLLAEIDNLSEEELRALLESE